MLYNMWGLTHNIVFWINLVLAPYYIALACNFPLAFSFSTMILS